MKQNTLTLNRVKTCLGNSIDLEIHYDKLYTESIKKIKEENVEVDKLIDSKRDKRYGITLLARPDEEVRASLNNFIGELKSIDPDQYYYPPTDLHITVMSIISCYSGFRLENVDVRKYISLVSECIRNIQSFDIMFYGITTSNNCVMVQGFPCESTLEIIRDNLRTSFRNSELEQSLDKRYKIQTAHITIGRFKKKLKGKINYINLLDNYRHFNFGTSRIRELELVSNDWYQRFEKVQLLHQFKLD